jgi:hypothetical protein
LGLRKAANGICGSEKIAEKKQPKKIAAICLKRISDGIIVEMQNLPSRHYVKMSLGYSELQRSERFWGTTLLARNTKKLRISHLQTGLVVCRQY